MFAVLACKRRLLLPGLGLVAAAIVGCGASSPSRVPSVAEMARLRAHLADAQTGAARHDRATVVSALGALSADVTVLRRSGTLSPELAATLNADVAQARRRAALELPAPATPAPPATAAPQPAATATTPTTPNPAAPPAPVPAQGKPGKADKPPKQPKPPKDNGGHKDHGNHGNGNGGD